MKEKKDRNLETRDSGLEPWLCHLGFLLWVLCVPVEALVGGGANHYLAEKTTFTPPLPLWRGRQKVWVQQGAPTCKCQLKVKGRFMWACTSLWGFISCQAQQAQEPWQCPRQ